MTDITQYLPRESPIVSAIYDHYKTEGDAEEPRGYLGASIIGHHCSRYLWYLFRGCTKEDFPGRLYRLFDTGDREEERMAENLRSIGCVVHTHVPPPSPAYIEDIAAKPKQFEINTVYGHFSGHMDGCALGIPTAEKTWHVLEFKTHNTKSFGKLTKEGVKKSKPVHYAQMQIYMHETGMTRALYLAVNKDTDELYAERVYYDKTSAESLLAKAKQIIFARVPPARITERPDWYECKFCSAHSLCWGIGEVALPVPSITCRQCCHSSPTKDGRGRWVCEKQGRALSWLDQKAACDEHLVLPGLLSFAEPTDYGKTPNPSPSMKDFEFIEFTNADGNKWRHGQASGHFNTRELRTLPISALSSPMLIEAKGLFDAEATHHYADDILSRYPESDTELVWRGPADKLQEEWVRLQGSPMSAYTEITKVDTGDYRAVEFEGGLVVVVRSNRKLHPAEIWKGKQ